MQAWRGWVCEERWRLLSIRVEAKYADHCPAKTGETAERMFHGHWLFQDFAEWGGGSHQSFHGEGVQKGLLVLKLFVGEIVKINSLTHLWVSTEAEVVVWMLFQQTP